MTCETAWPPSCCHLCTYFSRAAGTSTCVGSATSELSIWCCLLLIVIEFPSNATIRLEAPCASKENGEILSQLLVSCKHFTVSSVEKCAGEDKLQTYQGSVLSYL